MKRIQKLVIALLVISAVLPACKKGADDPFLSLRSRKSRVAGEWKVDSKIDTRTTAIVSSSFTSTSTETTTISGSTWTQMNSSSTTTSAGAVDYTIKFEKDGKWNSSYKLTRVNSLGIAPFVTTITTEDLTVSSGVWNFLGKVGDAKNKENISVSTTSEQKTTTTTTVDPSGTDINKDESTETFAANENVEIWKLTELKNKEMKGEIAYDNNFSSGSSSKRVSGTTTITLKQ